MGTEDEVEFQRRWFFFLWRTALSNSAPATVCKSTLVCKWWLWRTVEIQLMWRLQWRSGNEQVLPYSLVNQIPLLFSSCLTLSLVVKPIKIVKLAFRYTQSFVLWIWLLHHYRHTKYDCCAQHYTQMSQIFTYVDW